MKRLPRSATRVALLCMALGPAWGFATDARAQPLDMSHGGPVEISASDGIEWHQNDQTVTAIGNAHAVRGNVTVVADRLIAFYRKKAGTTDSAAPAPVAARQGVPSPADDQNGGNEIFRLEAVGNVHMFTTTDQGECDKAVYDIDQAVLVMTGHALKLTTPQDVITARDAMEYWSQKHMAVARGDAVITTNDAREVSADTVVAYMTDPSAPAPEATAKPAPPPPGAKAGSPTQDDPLATSGKLQRVEAFGNVVIRTTTQTVIGDRGVYVPDTGIARMAGATKLTQGQNQVNGEGLEVNLNTGIYRLISQAGERVHGLVMPNDSNGNGGSAPGATTGDTGGSGKSAAPKKGTP